MVDGFWAEFGQQVSLSGLATSENSRNRNYSVEKGLELCEEAQKGCEACAVDMTAWYLKDLQVEIQVC